MATFEDIVEGYDARKTIQFGTGTAHIDGATGEWVPGEHGRVVELDVRPLSPSEESRAKQKAREHAIAHGVEDPQPGDEIYDDALIIATLAFACIEKESPREAPRPFFTGGFDQILNARSLTDDHLGYLYEEQQLWTDLVAPRIKNQTPGEFMAAVVASAEGDRRFFAGARRGMQWSFVHTLAATYLNSLTHKSLSSSGSSSSAISSTESPSDPSTAH